MVPDPKGGPERGTFAAEELRAIGRAPVCPNCPDTYMVPVNDENMPDLCRCVTCGAEEWMEWVN